MFGANGRAGRAVTAEARRRGHHVTAATRTTADITDAGAVAAIAEGHDAAVHAVTPASSPEELGEVDPTFFVRAADALLQAPVERIVAIGLFATLTANGTPVYEDETRFPPFLKPFAHSHEAGLERFKAAGDGPDWAMLVPTEAAVDYDALAAAIVDEIDSPTTHRATRTL